MQLCQPEALRVLNDHHGRLRHIDTHLDHRGGDEDGGAAGGEVGHCGVLVAPLHLAMDQSDCVAEPGRQRGVALLGRGDVEFLGFVDQGADPIGACARCQRPANGLHHLVKALDGQHARVDRLTASRLLAQRRDIHVAEEGQDQRPRDGRCGHHQHVDRVALA